ncbi:MAG TPA: LCP family protein [Pseudonocardiaceae bacterium]|nr:LCP family protein [Pseudonocardiaceae bacterium]
MDDWSRDQPDGRQSGRRPGPQLGRRGPDQPGRPVAHANRPRPAGGQPAAPAARRMPAPQQPARPHPPVRRPAPPRPQPNPNAIQETDRTPAVDDRPDDRPPPRRPARRPPPRSPRRAIGLHAGRTALAIVSVFALVATGYAWNTLQRAQSGLQTADVLDQKATAKPPDGSMDILLVGMDSRTDAKGNALPQAVLNQLHAGQDTGELDTDTMILIHIPTGGGKAIGVSIPRDSWVNIPGYGMGKINSAYGLAKNAELRTLKANGGMSAAQRDVMSNQAGAKEAIETVEQLTGVGIDHYAAVNLDGFYQISNAIGGVPVCLLHPVNDTHWSGAVFPAGHFNVEGVKALEFVRQRHNIPGGSTDLEREQRQQAFMASMAHKILSQGVLTSPGTLDKLITAIQSAITIDNRWNLLDFAQEMSGMSSGAIKFQTVPVVNIDYHPTGGSLSAVEVDPAQVNAFVHGTTGVPTTGAPGVPAAPTGNGAITVDVTNASGQTGLAGNVLDELAAKGFTKGQTGNGAHRSQSVLFYSSGQVADAQAVQAALNNQQFTLEEGSSVPSGHVWVYVGRDFQGASNASDVIVGHHQQATDIAYRQTAPTTTAPAAPSTPPGGGPAITDNGTAPCVN